ncbi:MAG: hypothetical protein AB7Q81_18745 [Gammaproteobacteria bacterium]
MGIAAIIIVACVERFRRIAWVVLGMIRADLVDPALGVLTATAR